MNKKSKKKLLFVLGTRPEALKLAPLIVAAKTDQRFKPIVCLTGQHRSMVDQVMSLFSIQADYDLNLMKPSQSLTDLLSRICKPLENVICRTKPDILLVQGDTTTAFVAALVSFYQKIPIAHIEAGLRSRQKYFPFPEEINRDLISRLADLHFAPTLQAKKNLLREGVSDRHIFITGNTIVDTINQMRQRSKPSALNLLKSIKSSQRILLVTAHRRESFGAPLIAISNALKKIVEMFPDVNVVFPVHLNPKVRQIVFRELKRVKRIHLIEPLSYDQFIALMARSYLILTDSGGIQEEAPSLKRPVLIMRDVTERLEGVKHGFSKLVGTNEKSIIKEASRILTNRGAYQKMISRNNPYGDGKATRRILNLLAQKKFK